MGDLKLASQCLRLALSVDANHAPAYNNLGVLEHRRGNTSQARALFQAAASLAPYLYEPHYNHSSIAKVVSISEVIMLLFKQFLWNFNSTDTIQCN